MSASDHIASAPLGRQLSETFVQGRDISGKEVFRNRQQLLFRNRQQLLFRNRQQLLLCTGTLLEGLGHSICGNIKKKLWPNPGNSSA